MTSRSLPPTSAERLLRATVRDAEWREAITGDLREEFAAFCVRRGLSAARRWYWRQVVPLSARFVASRLMPSVAPSRRRIAIADIERTSTLGSGWSRELRHAWRAIWQRPGLSAVIIGTLGVALTANAVIFNLADALYLRPFRFAGVDRLVLIASDTNGDRLYFDRESVSPADFLDWTRTATTVRELAAVEWWDPNLSGVDRPERVHGSHITPGFFALMRVQPLLGRSFAADAGRPGNRHEVVLSHAFWLRRFQGDPNVIGTTMRLDGTLHEVVGVMPPRFAVPYGAEVWAPIGYDDAAWAERGKGRLMVFGRLTDGQTLDAAHAELESLAARQAVVAVEHDLRHLEGR